MPFFLASYFLGTSEALAEGYLQISRSQLSLVSEPITNEKQWVAWAFPQEEEKLVLIQSCLNLLF
jgi:hypothetical protein